MNAESFCVFEKIVVRHETMPMNSINMGLRVGVYEVDVIMEVGKDVND